MTAILIAMPVYIVITMIMAYVWNIIFFRNIYSSMIGAGLRENPIIPLGLASTLLESIALAFLFTKFFQGNSPILEGLALGLIAGVFSICYAALVVPSKFTIQRIGLFITMESIFGILHFGFIGILFGFIFKIWGNI